MKRFVLAIVIFLSVLSIPIKGNAAINYSEIGIHSTSAIYVDGKRVDFGDAKAYVVKGRILVPFRAIFEEMGAEVNWEQQTQIVSAKMKKGSEAVELRIPVYTWKHWYDEWSGVNLTVLTYERGDELIRYLYDHEVPRGSYIQRNYYNPSLNISESHIVKSDTEPQSIHNRLMVPLRLIGENLDYGVNWDQKSKVASLTKKHGPLRVDIKSGYRYEIVGEIFGMDTFDIHTDLFFNTHLTREKHGAKALGLHAELSQIAFDKRYRTNINEDPHYDLVYGSPAAMLDTLAFDPKYTYTTEIICICSDPIEGWLGSKKGHRESLLADRHTHVGIAHRPGWQIEIFVRDDAPEVDWSNYY